MECADLFHPSVKRVNHKQIVIKTIQTNICRTVLIQIQIELHFLQLIQDHSVFFISFYQTAPKPKCPNGLENRGNLFSSFSTKK